jgi:hypothetical protein
MAAEQNKTAKPISYQAGSQAEAAESISEANEAAAASFDSRSAALAAVKARAREKPPGCIARAASSPRLAYRILAETKARAETQAVSVKPAVFKRPAYQGCGATAAIPAITLAPKPSGDLR